MQTYTVKARKRTGSPSFDLTIPTEIARKYKISGGDIFEVRVSKEEKNLVLKFKLIYQKP